MDVEQGEGTYQNIEIFDIAFGAAHRASVSVASTRKKEIQKKRFKNKTSSKTEGQVAIEQNKTVGYKYTVCSKPNQPKNYIIR